MQDGRPGEDQIAAFRAFNRFHTRRAGVLEEGLLKSAFTLAEARVLYELATRVGTTASELARDLGLDPGYLSRILKSFAAKGLLGQARSPSDGRVSVLRLTAAGQAAFAPLDAASRADAGAMLARLDERQRRDLLAAMARIETLLGERLSLEEPFTLRDLRPGDIGWVIHRQARLYHEEYGWDGSYEGLIAGIFSEFVRNFDPRAERGWIAERDGNIVGSVFLVRKSEKAAKLRLLYVEPSARGLGIGRRLTEECIAQAKAFGYSTLTLWTNDILVSARRIYEAAGFRLVKEEMHHSFGKDLVGQDWELDLDQEPAGVTR